MLPRAQATPAPQPYIHLRVAATVGRIACTAICRTAPLRTAPAPAAPLAPAQVCRELRPRALQALLLDAAVWLVADEDVAYKLDTLCFGNMDGGAGTAAAVRAALEAGGAPCQPGGQAVRLSLDEAFFMAWALGILTVHEAPEPGGGGAAARLDDTVRERRRGAGWVGTLRLALAVRGRWWRRLQSAAAAYMRRCFAQTPTALRSRSRQHPSPHPLSSACPQALWLRCQALRPDFFTLYLAYHHYRSKASAGGGSAAQATGFQDKTVLPMVPPPSSRAASPPPLE